jgi:pilus assembly protein CpaE
VYPVTVATVLETKELWDELHACVQDLPVRFLLELSDTGDQAAFLEKLSRVSPDVVFLDVGKLKANAAETIRAIKAGIGSPAVIALNMEAEPTAILDSMRAGAAEFLYPPFGEQLRGALERISAERSKVIHSARRGGKVVGFLSAKGGCGATTIACHTAVDLPGLKPNTKVLLADLDFDSGLIGFLLKTKSTYSVLDAARNTQRLDANYWNALVSNGIPGVEIITAPPPPLQQLPRADALRFVLNFSRANYDWIVVDLGRNLSLTTMSTLEQIDELFIVTTLEVPALHQTKLVVQKLLESGYQRKQIHLLLNRTPDRFDVTIQELEAMLDASVYSVIPNLYVALNDSYSEGKLVGRDTELGRHFDKLAMKIAGVEPPKKKKFSLFG